MRSGTITLTEGTLETAWWGPGPEAAPTLVLLHEGLGSVGLWRDVPERLAEATGWGVFAYSRFGYGGSSPTTLPRPMDYMQREAMSVLPRVLGQAGISRAALLGHSDGGSIAAVYAGAASSGWMGGAGLSETGVRPAPSLASRPGLAGSSTTLSGPAPSVLDGRTKHDRDAMDAAVGDATNGAGNDATDGAGRDGETWTAAAPAPAMLGLITIAAHFLVEDLNITSIERIKRDYDTGDLRQRLARHHRDVDIAFRGWNDAWLDPRFRAFDITGFLPRIEVPVLAIQGTNDPYGSDEQLHVMQRHVRAPITVELIAGARHSPHLEAPDATLAVITRFIATLGNPSR